MLKENTSNHSVSWITFLQLTLASTFVTVYLYFAITGCQLKVCVCVCVCVRAHTHALLLDQTGSPRQSPDGMAGSSLCVCARVVCMKHQCMDGI